MADLRFGGKSLTNLVENPAPWFFRPLVGGRFAFRSVRVREGELVDVTDIISFHDEFKVENIKKGIVFTNGYFSEEAVFQGEDRPMELLNRQDLLAWAHKFAINMPGEPADPSA